ncbi:MAG: GerW family sporulation protein [Clostridia bacterium]|nr:GerW family sporulation protein [Clostridia bacterium]
MNEHPIEGLMITAMNSIQDMIDVNTIIGEPIEAPNNIVIIPISKVTFGFAAGGSEFSGETVDEYNKKDKEEQIQYRLPFGGGSGAGVTINPVAFLIISEGKVKLIPVNHSSALDKLLDYVPDLLEKASNIMNKCLNEKKETAKEILKNMKNKEQEEKIEVEKDKKNNIKKITVEREVKKPETKEDNTQSDFQLEFENMNKEDKKEIDLNEFEDE